MNACKHHKPRLAHNKHKALELLQNHLLLSFWHHNYWYLNNRMLHLSTLPQVHKFHLIEQNNNAKTKKLPFGEIAVWSNRDLALVTSNINGIIESTSFTTNLIVSWRNFSREVMSIILSSTGFTQSFTKFEIKLFVKKQCSKFYPQHSEQHFAMLELLSPKCCTIDFLLFLDADNEGLMKVRIWIGMWEIRANS